MATVVNDRDVMLEATVPRYVVDVGSKNMQLAVTTPVFKVTTAGVPSPTHIDITAVLTNIAGTATMTCDHGTLTQVGNVATLQYADMTANSATVTATITELGITYTRNTIINKIFDGASGTNGVRGTVQIAGNAGGVGYTVWSDAAAVTELTARGYNPPINNDIVTLYGATGFSETRFYAGGTWYVLSQYLNGNLLIDGTVAAQKIFAATISAISANLGDITGGDLNGLTIHAGAGYPTNAYAWPNGAGNGFHLSANGLRIGDYNGGAAGAQYVEISPTGRFAMPGMVVDGGVANFSGALNGASGNFAGNVYTGSGTGFRVELGPDDPTYAIWAGSGTKNDVNAVFYLKKSGAGYFGGSLSAGTLRTAITNPSLDPAAQNVDGPFGSNGGAINVVCSYQYDEYGSSSKSTYTASGPACSASIQLYRKIGSGAEELVQSSTFGGSTDIENEVEPLSPSFYQMTIGGSFTYTDTAHSTSDRTYRAVITNRTTQSMTLHDKGAGGTDNGVIASQTLTIVTTE